MEEPRNNKGRRRSRRSKSASQPGGNPNAQPIRGSAQRGSRTPGRNASRGPGRGTGRTGTQPKGGGANANSPRSVPLGQLPSNLIYGLHTIGIALDQQLLKVLFFDQSRMNERIQHMHAQAADQGVELRPLQKQGWSRVLPPDLHQGIAGILHEIPPVFLEDIIGEVGEDSAILILDQVQDPQNLGAILRTAAATGVDAVVLPKAGGCPVTAAVHRASAGLSLMVRIVEDENLARAVEFLKDHGYWVVGCDSEGGEDATVFEFPHKRAIVMGNEADGMRRLVRESCDFLVRIPMAPGVESLNVSVATAVVLYLAKADLARAALEIAEPAEQQ